MAHTRRHQSVALRAWLAASCHVIEQDRAGDVPVIATARATLPRLLQAHRHREVLQLVRAATDADLLA